jgi:hypothetical protein
MRLRGLRTVAIVCALFTVPHPGLAQGAKSVALAGTVTDVKRTGIVTMTDVRTGKRQATTDSHFKLRDQSGQEKAVYWGLDPETKVLNNDGKPAHWDDIKKAAKVEVNAADENGRLVAREVRIQTQ